MDLSATQRKFILHWGEMGTKWGINRTVAQVHALLFVSPEPLNAEEIAATLSVARSNVSTSLRELQGWGLASVVHRLGDRRDYFETFDDVWAMYHVVMEERKRREIDPTIALLRQCVAESAGDADDAHTHERLSSMLDFVETMTQWYNQVRKLPPSAFTTMARMGGKLMDLLPGNGRGKGSSSKTKPKT
ncbi:MAG: MarR family transcriptional regulator [Phycisphaera sp.]|nr:MarR family transcriptional regulator [Phycisphaera sp.]